MRQIGVLLVLVACHGVPTETPDAPIVPDGPDQGLGMYVLWNAEPALPGSVTDKVTVSEAVFQVEHLQLVSDAGADGRTTRSRYQLRWAAQASPPRDAFPDAPVAVYQRISIDMRPGFQLPHAYEISGIWRGDRGAKPFQVVDDDGIVIPIDCSVALPAGGSVAIDVRVDLDDALSNIDFRNVPEDNGVLVLNGGSQMLEFRDRLMRAFKIEN